MVDFSMGCSWTANQKRPRSAKENVDNFLDKDTRRRPATAADVPPANREFGRCSHAAHQTSYASCRSYYEHSPLCKRTCKRSGTAATLESRGGGDWGLNDGERAPPGGSPKAGAAANLKEGLDDGERAPPCSSAKAGAAATGRLDDGERAPSDGSAEAGAAAMGVLDDGEPWDASDDFDSHAATPDDSPLSSNTTLSHCAPPSLDLL